MWLSLERACHWPPGSLCSGLCSTFFPLACGVAHTTFRNQIMVAGLPGRLLVAVAGCVRSRDLSTSAHILCSGLNKLIKSMCPCCDAHQRRRADERTETQTHTRIEHSARGLVLVHRMHRHLVASMICARFDSMRLNIHMHTRRFFIHANRDYRAPCAQGTASSSSSCSHKPTERAMRPGAPASLRFARAALERLITNMHAHPSHCINSHQRHRYTADISAYIV